MLEAVGHADIAGKNAMKTDGMFWIASQSKAMTATNMEIRPAKGLVIIWMVQHASFPGNGANAQGVFRNWAMEHFGK